MEFPHVPVDGDSPLLSAALEEATFIIQIHPSPIAIEFSARQFLTREILKLYREGERDVRALAADAAASLRNYVQINKSAHRVSEEAH